MEKVGANFKILEPKKKPVCFNLILFSENLNFFHLCGYEWIGKKLLLDLFVNNHNCAVRNLSTVQAVFQGRGEDSEYNS